MTTASERKAREKVAPLWEFDWPDGGHLRVHYGTGHWAARINTKTLETMGGVYIYEATWTQADGTVKEICITQAHFRHLRRKAHRDMAEKGRERDLIEQLADKEHASWARWQEYLHSLCEMREDGALVIPADRTAHWQRQIDTPYAGLSEREKQSDREEVEHILPIIRAYAEGARP